MNPARTSLCLLLLTAAAAQASPYPAAAVGIWTGRYDCAQGSTALELDVSLADPTHLQALFYFHALPQNPYVPDGCFLMRGSFDDAAQALTLSPTQWLLQPAGYVWVALNGTLGADGVLAGNITGPGCSDFSLRHGSPAAQMPVACKSPATLDVS